MGNREEAERLFEKAMATIREHPDQWQHAYHLYGNACYTDPTWATAWYQQGNNSGDLQWRSAAIACWRRALTCDPDPQLKAKILANLGWQLQEQGDVKEALEVLKLATETDPDLVAGWINLSCVYGTLRDTKKSLVCAQRGAALAPDDQQAKMALAFSYLFDGQWSKGLSTFECRYQYRLRNFLHYPYPQWQGEPNKTVLLVFDQGLGDTICYSRFLEQAAKRCRYLYVCIQRELLDWFQNAFLHLDNVNIIPSQTTFPGNVEYWTTFVSLPAALDLNDREIVSAEPIKMPPLAPLPPNWRVPDMKLHIGISWAGSGLNPIDRHRSMPIQNFFSLYRVPGIQLYSLQVDDRKADLGTSGAIGGLVRDLSPYVASVSDTLRILKHLDLVITCESALGHICSAAGVECWIPYSYLGRDYRLGPSGDAGLWNKHRTFNQRSDLRWEPVFAEIVKALRKRVQ